MSGTWSPWTGRSVARGPGMGYKGMVEREFSSPDSCRTRRETEKCPHVHRKSHQAAKCATAKAFRRNREET